jgi:hypothetical protein
MATLCTGRTASPTVGAAAVTEPARMPQAVRSTWVRHNPLQTTPATTVSNHRGRRP